MATGDAQLMETDATLIERPVFVIGAPRSGTSVLAWSLAQHSRFWTSGETDVLYELFGDGYVDLVLQRLRERPLNWFSAQDVSHSELMAALGLGFNRLFSSRSGGRRWIDQSPSYTMMVPELAEMFPGAQFVHIWRDGREVVRSMLRSGFSEAWATDFREACRVWRCGVELAAGYAAREPDRCTSVRYADLVAEPEVTFAILFEFLGVQTEHGPARFFRENRINTGAVDQRGDPGTSDRRTAEWTDEETDIFLAETWPLLEKYDLPERALLARLPVPVAEQTSAHGCDHVRRNGARARIARGGTIRDLEALVDERTTWARLAESAVQERDQTIDELRRALAVTIESAEGNARAVEERDATIRSLLEAARPGHGGA